MRNKIRAGIALLLAGLTTCFAGACVNQGAINETLALQQRLEELQQQNASIKAEKESLQQQFDELNGLNQTVLDELKGLEDTINGPPLESGFYTKEYSPETIALKSDRSRFDIDDVTLDFYLGIAYISPYDIETFGDYFYDIYFTDGGYHGPEYLVKSVEEPFYSEDYKYEVIEIDKTDYVNFYRYEHKLKKYHTLTIPKEFFCGITGQFYISLRFTEKTEEPYSKWTFFGMPIYYKIEYGKVALSTNFNDLK